MPREKQTNNASRWKDIKILIIDSHTETQTGFQILL